MVYNPIYRGIIFDDIFFFRERMRHSLVETFFALFIWYYLKSKRTWGRIKKIECTAKYGCILVRLDGLELSACIYEVNKFKKDRLTFTNKINQMDPITEILSPLIEMGRSF